ncbi:hypothetical protein METBIDRAFT_29408 [Metschnikowia bicuspidata var. bicuspidata NRRL YB-4993]|uniref:Uncharacterized protein n=1 Tax=Metschnikowia bicuspidata var. bicuspidata NRRL YB-4993 TaxID=869754 RepID=A0A1A0HG46_9ASCO|nr:hypothetical protein METBIDRAFT_29408 [Metschnikowia bicuspidata var. bicuspidata NRRL YB-4993]OBA22828.1 hypothetical protein METBIDRAFT_29408 [Metschnikowia bicuspidata var. bicuspidata NRRL YB-4993]
MRFLKLRPGPGSRIHRRPSAGAAPLILWTRAILPRVQFPTLSSQQHQHQTPKHKNQKQIKSKSKTKQNKSQKQKQKQSQEQKQNQS